MPYGTIKVDTVTFTDAGVDKSVSISGLVQNPTFSGNVTVTGTISGVTVTGTTASFTSGNFTNISAGTYTITSGVFSAGSETNPSISFASDPNTGIYSPGADQVAIAAAGSGRLFVGANGVVTIQNGAAAIIGTLTDGATITPDFAANCNFAVTLGGSRTLANPTNITAGQSGSIFIVQDATGSRTLSWGSYWDFPGGTAPTLSTAANAVDRIDYIVRSSTSIHTVFTANYS